MLGVHIARILTVNKYLNFALFKIMTLILYPFTNIRTADENKTAGAFYWYAKRVHNKRMDAGLENHRHFTLAAFKAGHLLRSAKEYDGEQSRTQWLSHFVKYRHYLHHSYVHPNYRSGCIAKML